LLAMILALGALLVVFGKNVSGENPVVKAIWNVANAIDGPFGRDDGVFHFTGKDGPKLNALVNWGLAAVIYLIIGNVLRKFLTKNKYHRQMLAPRRQAEAALAAASPLGRNCDCPHPAVSCSGPPVRSSLGPTSHSSRHHL